jgi:hypothetical protein
VLPLVCISSSDRTHKKDAFHIVKEVKPLPRGVYINHLTQIFKALQLQGLQENRHILSSNSIKATTDVEPEVAALPNKANPLSGDEWKPALRYWFYGAVFPNIHLQIKNYEPRLESSMDKTMLMKYELILIESALIAFHFDLSSDDLVIFDDVFSTDVLDVLEGVLLDRSEIIRRAVHYACDIQHRDIVSDLSKVPVFQISNYIANTLKSSMEQHQEGNAANARNANATHVLVMTPSVRLATTNLNLIAYYSLMDASGLSLGPSGNAWRRSYIRFIKIIGRDMQPLQRSQPKDFGR